MPHSSSIYGHGVLSKDKQFLLYWRKIMQYNDDLRHQLITSDCFSTNKLSHDIALLSSTFFQKVKCLYNSFSLIPFFSNYNNSSVTKVNILTSLNPKIRFDNKRFILQFRLTLKTDIDLHFQKSYLNLLDTNMNIGWTWLKCVKLTFFFFFFFLKGENCLA